MERQSSIQRQPTSIQHQSNKEGNSEGGLRKGPVSPPPPKGRSGSSKKDRETIFTE